MARPGHGWARAAGGLALALLILWPCAPAAAQASLQIWTLEPRRMVFSVAMEPGQVFTLEHQNSIYLALVRETYRVGPNGELRQVMLESPSAGVFEYHGHDPPSGGRAFLERPLGALRLRSASYEHHRLLVGGQAIPLMDLAQPGQPLLLQVVTP
ncbi:MAG: hypothetical protein HY910_00315 [Desulfarculus sp.]|nr:hypothetical protein [Desulfarculus sp.]